MTGLVHRIRIPFALLALSGWLAPGAQAACLGNLQGVLEQGGMIWGTTA